MISMADEYINLPIRRFLVQNKEIPNFYLEVCALPPLRGKVAGGAGRMRGVERSETASSLSAQRCTDTRHRKHRRGNDQFIGQSQDPKSLPDQPCISLAVFHLAFFAMTARPIDFDNQPPIEAYEVDDEIHERHLPAKLRALAPPIPNGAPDDRLGLHVA